MNEHKIQFKFMACISSILALTIVTGCTAKFTTSPYYDLDLGKPQKGIPIKLPKSVISYKVYLMLYKAKQSENAPWIYFVWLNKKRQEANGSIIELSTTTIGDDEAVFVVNISDLSRFNVWTKQSGLSLTEDGVLTAINAEFEDRTTEIIKNTVSAGFRLAKIAAYPAGKLTGRADTPESEFPVIKEVTDFMVEGSMSYRELASGYSGKADSFIQIDTSFARKKLQTYVGSASFDFPPIYIGIQSGPHFDQVFTHDVADELSAKPFFMPRKYSGVFVRQANSVPVMIQIERTVVARKDLLIADAGPTTLVPFKSKLATTRNQSLEFHKSTGSVSKFSFSTTSSGEKLSSTLDEVSKTVETELPKVYEAEQTREDDRFKLTNDIAAEASLLRKSQRRIAEIDRKKEALEEQYKKLENDEPPLGVTPEQIIEQKTKIREEQAMLKDERFEEMNKAETSYRRIEYLEDTLQSR